MSETLIGSYEGSSPRNVASAQFLFNLPKHFELDATYRYSATLPEFNLGSYSTADIRLGWHFGGVSFPGFSLCSADLSQPPTIRNLEGIPVRWLGIKRTAFAKMTWRKARVRNAT